jgi:hypothetical protein
VIEILGVCRRIEFVARPSEKFKIKAEAIKSPKVCLKNIESERNFLEMKKCPVAPLVLVQFFDQASPDIFLKVATWFETTLICYRHRAWLASLGKDLTPGQIRSKQSMFQSI